MRNAELIGRNPTGREGVALLTNVNLEFGTTF